MLINTPPPRSSSDDHSLFLKTITVMLCPCRDNSIPPTCSMHYYHGSSQILLQQLKTSPRPNNSYIGPSKKYVTLQEREGSEKVWQFVTGRGKDHMMSHSVFHNSQFLMFYFIFYHTYTNLSCILTLHFFPIFFWSNLIEYLWKDGILLYTSSTGSIWDVWMIEPWGQP